MLLNLDELLHGGRRNATSHFKRFLEEARERPENVMVLSGVSILDLEERDQKEIIVRSARVLADGSESAIVLTRVGNLLGRLLNQELTYDVADLPDVIETIGSIETETDLEASHGVAGLLEIVRRSLDDALPDETLRVALESLRARLDEGAQSGAIKRIDAILSGNWHPSLLLHSVDAWSAQMIEILARDHDTQAEWGAVLDHCATATQPKPSKRWLKNASILIATLGFERHAAGLASVLEAVGAPSPVPVDLPGDSYQPTARIVGHPTQVSDRFADMLRGMVWSALLHNDHLGALIPRIGDAAERCFAKLPNHGPLAPKIGNACLMVLGRVESLDAVGQLARLESRAKHASTRKQIAKAKHAAAKALGMSDTDLEELGAPTGGLTAVGHHEESVGDFSAEVVVEGTRSVTLCWRTSTADDKPKVQKTVPKAVKDDHTADLKRIKKQISELKKLLPPQRDRVERLLRNGRTLSFADWRARYLDHPLVGVLGRRLIWQISNASNDSMLVAWSPDAKGRWVDADDRPVTPPDDAQVRLWHPASSPAAEVAAWQEWLIRHGVTQPFKQAHREIYVLTDAERETGTYSNRFAAHVLKQHQFLALCQARGWTYTLQGRWDSHNTPFIDLQDAGIRARLVADPIDEDQISDSYVFLFLSTDRVEFRPLDGFAAMPLEDVPPLLFSELMRDVDLFVGVASVGNDPTWQDGGHEGRHALYWADFSFGVLDAPAETRRRVLASLVPKLKIADRCTLDDRFLEVRGQLRTYRIHLGSANIQMAPNNQYLCIVPKSSRAGSAVTLPFEGDAKLSLILSKAFMLADDHKIKDGSITNQIRSARKGAEP